MKRKPKTIAKLKKDLAIVFNKYIRLRDCTNGMGICISCQKPYPYEKMHAGHFIPSTYSAVRFDEDNVHAQCGFNCNVNKRGNLTEYRPNLIKKIGVERVEALEARRHDPVKWNRAELEALIEEYKLKLKQFD